jgi:hypothetical protein
MTIAFRQNDLPASLTMSWRARSTVTWTVLLSLLATLGCGGQTGAAPASPAAAADCGTYANVNDVEQMAGCMTTTAQVQASDATLAEELAKKRDEAAARGAKVALDEVTGLAPGNARAQRLQVIAAEFSDWYGKVEKRAAAVRATGADAASAVAAALGELCPMYPFC